MRRARGVGILLVSVVVVVWLATSWSSAVLESASMEPWAEPGDLLVHRIVPVAQIEVDDVITVPVPGRGLVTHRVVELRGTAGAPRAVLQGDRSRFPDPDPVDLPEAVDRVVVVVPQLGSALRIGGPWLLAAATLLVLGLGVIAVTRRRAGHTADPSPRPAAGSAPPDPRLEALLATCEQLVDDGLAEPVVADVVRVRTAAIAGLPPAEGSGAVLSLDDGARFYVLAVADADPAMLALVPASSRRRRDGSEALDLWWAAVAGRLDDGTASVIDRAGRGLTSHARRP